MLTEVYKKTTGKNNSLPQFEVNSIPSCGYFQAKFLSFDPRQKRKDHILPLNKSQRKTPLLHQRQHIM